MPKPEELHDGNAPASLSFTYKMLHLDPQWLKPRCQDLFTEPFERSIESALQPDQQLASLILSAYSVLDNKKPQLMKDSYLDLFLEKISQPKLFISTGKFDPHVAQYCI